jgi:hypothetical protein
MTPEEKRNLDVATNVKRKKHSQELWALDVTDPKRPRRVALPQELRYLHMSEVLRDFPSKRDRAAMAAVFAWLSLNGSCGRRLKRSGHITVAWTVKELMSAAHDVVVYDVKRLDEAEGLVAPKAARGRK